MMSDYSNKLASIAAKKQKLLEEESRLVEKRKHEISSTAEKFGLLTASDEFITGLFIEAAKAFHEKSERAKGWESEGINFIKNKKQHAQAT